MHNPPKLPPASPFAPAEYLACCHAHPLRFLQGFDHLLVTTTPLTENNVQCEMARQCSLAELPSVWHCCISGCAALQREEFQ